MVEGVEQRDAIMQGKHHASHESESNISVASTNRDGGNEVEVKQFEFGAAKTHP